MRKPLLLFILFFVAFGLQAQSPGLIYHPPGGLGVTPLNPNGDGWSSVSTTGYVTNDISESEIPFYPLPVPYAEPTSDLVRGADCRFSDIVRIDAFDSGVYMYSDGTNLMYRFRQGGTVPGSKGYSILIDADMKFGGSGPNADPNYIPKTTGINGNPGFEFEIVLETNFQVAVYNIDGTDNPGAPILSYDIRTAPTNRHHQRSVALTNNCDDPDYFHDFYIILAQFYAATAATAHPINSGTPLRMAATTVMAPKPAMGGPISDINGGGNFEEIIGYQCGTPIGIGPSSGAPCSCTNPPSINGPIPSGTSVPITGNWSPTSGTKPNNATIEVFVNGTSAGTTTTTGGAGWGMTLPGPLVNGDTIYATAQATGEGVCDPNPQIIIVSDCAGNTPAAPVITCIPTNLKGIAGTSLPNATIRIYRYMAPPISPTQNLLVTITADATGNWGWTGPPSTTNDPGSCNGGSANMTEGTYRVTQSTAAFPSCPSPSASACLDRPNGQNSTDITGVSNPPVITTNPIVSSVGTIAGTAVTGEIIRLYINGQLRATRIAAANTFSFTGISPLPAGATVAVTAQGTANCESAEATRIVACSVPAPLITTNDAGQVAVGSVIAGTSTQIGATINIYNNAAPTVSLGTAVVGAGGTWTSAVAATAGITYMAKVTTACGQSAASNLAVAIAPTPNRCGAFTGTPYNNTTPNVSGTLSSAVANTTVRLYIDGGLIGTVVTGTTNWTIAVAPGELYGGGVLSFGIQEPGRMEFRCSATTPVACTPPPPFTFTPASLTISSSDGTATFRLSNTTAGVLYLIEDVAIPNIDRGVSKFSTGADFDLVTFPFTQAGTYNLQIRGMTFNGVGCDVIGATTIIVPDGGIDGLADPIDIDDDDDGIPDVIEICGIGAVDFSCIGGDPSGDADNDGILNYQDPDFCTLNGFGVCANLDNDNDGIINSFDLDSDNDGIPDIVEAGGVDTNGDGRVDVMDDTDGDGLYNMYDTTDGGNNILNLDTDGDGIPNFLDLDADNDGIQDILEAGGVDANGDGMVDSYTDTDNDGFHDPVDGDVGNDGTPENTANALVTTGTDANNDGVPDSYPKANADSDIVPNFLDLDSDNDGITDVVENASGIPTTGATTDSPSGSGLDGMIEDGGITDGNNNGWSDLKEGSTSMVDSDGDGIPDMYDIDADNDGIPDFLEGTCSTCPTFGAPGGGDLNGNGVLDMYETLNFANANGGTNIGINPNEDDNDGTGPPDYLDLDTDNDGSMDWAEGFDSGFGGGAAVAGDGSAANELINMAAAYVANGGPAGDYPATDSDGDGLPDWMDNLVGPGVTVGSPPPFLNPASPFWHDADNDGLADLFDNEINGNTWGETSPVPDNDAINDRDWRDLFSSVDLPIELIAFNAVRNNAASVLLTWSTASELNNKGFDVERMLENETVFTKIGFVDGVGTSIETNEYSYTDNNSFNGVSYYRLRQVDFDETFEYTHVRAVTGITTNGGSVTVFPIPTRDEIYVSFGPFSTPTKAVKFTLVDVLGRVVFEQHKTVNTSSIVTLNQFADLVPAYYTLVVSIEGKPNMTFKVVKK